MRDCSDREVNYYYLFIIIIIKIIINTTKAISLVRLQKPRGKPKGRKGLNVSAQISSSKELSENLRERFPFLEQVETSEQVREHCESISCAVKAPYIT